MSDKIKDTYIDGGCFVELPRKPEPVERIDEYIGQLWESFEVQRAAILGDGYQQKPATMNGDFYAGALHALDLLTSYMRGMKS